MSATVDIYTKKKACIVSVPVHSVATRKFDKSKREKDFDEELQEVIFIVEKDSIKLLDVKKGMSDSQYVEIQQGLDSAREVVTAPDNTTFSELEEEIKLKL